MSVTYDAVTAKIIEALAQGVVPWRKPWHTISSLPMNAVSKRPYSGVNVFLLTSTPYLDPRWLTFRQALELGGNVRKGEKSSIAVFWKNWKPEDPHTDSEHRSPKSIPILRHYHLFNVSQCEGLNLAESENVPPERVATRLDRAEAVVNGMPDPPRIVEGRNSAWYRPSEDLVAIPSISAFMSVDHYYSTLFHELGHATGHPSRLNRPGITAKHEFGSSGYGFEELVAELASAFCCAAIGLDNSLVADSASYIDNWLNVLERNPKAVVLAAGQAQRAANLIQNIAAELPS